MTEPDELRVSPTEHIAERVQEIQTTDSTGLKESRLVRAELLTHTNDENKDGDTGIYVTVTTKDTTSLLARIIRADSSNSDATEYNNGSDHLVELVVQNVAATRSACSGFQVTIGIATTGGEGNDEWRFDSQVVLYFSDGSTLFAKRDGINLTSGKEHILTTVVFNA